MKSIKLYHALAQKGLISINWEEFQEKLNDVNYQSKVHKAVVDNGMYSGDIRKFKDQYVDEKTQ